MQIYDENEAVDLLKKYNHLLEKGNSLKKLKKSNDFLKREEACDEFKYALSDFKKIASEEIYTSFSEDINKLEEVCMNLSRK